MTSQPASQSMAAGRTDDIPSSWDERTVLTTFLDYARDTVHAMCAGLSDADARRAPLPGSPLMTVSGLVSHLRWVESSWIEKTLLGGTIDAPWTGEDPDRAFRIAVEVPLPQLLPEYRAACTRHSELVAFGSHWYGHLIGNGTDRNTLFLGYMVGAGAMILGGIAAIFFGVNAEGKALEDIAKPLSVVAKPGQTIFRSGVDREGIDPTTP